MNRHTLARFLRLGLMSCIFLSCLIALQTPALALAIYNDFAQESLSAGSIPLGTSISFFPKSTSNSQSSSGNALATSAALDSTPGSVAALVSGFASEPGSASSFAVATGTASIFNANPTTVTFPLTVTHTRNLSLSTGPGEFGSSSALLSVNLDSSALFNNISICSTTCNRVDSGSDTFLFALTPGSHSLEFAVNASGFAESDAWSAVSPTPEPASLLLLGSTMAGLGLARWKGRRQK